uniref:Uncharacterized protein n=1 Tax=Arundo donax TaxID=35708 RepID=A0A0A8YD09_ARUDO
MSRCSPPSVKINYFFLMKFSLVTWCLSCKVCRSSFF